MSDPVRRIHEYNIFVYLKGPHGELASYQFALRAYDQETAKTLSAEITARSETWTQMLMNAHYLDAIQPAACNSFKGIENFFVHAQDPDRGGGQ